MDKRNARARVRRVIARDRGRKTDGEHRKGENEKRKCDTQPDGNAPRARYHDVIAPRFCMGIRERAHRVQRDRTNKYRLETKLISTRARQLRDYRELDYGVSC